MKIENREYQIIMSHNELIIIRNAIGYYLLGAAKKANWVSFKGFANTYKTEIIMYEYICKWLQDINTFDNLIEIIEGIIEQE